MMAEASGREYTAARGIAVQARTRSERCLEVVVGRRRISSVEHVEEPKSPAISKSRGGMNLASMGVWQAVV